MDRVERKFEMATVSTEAKLTQSFEEIASNLMVGTDVVAVLTVLTDRCVKALKVKGFGLMLIG